MLFRFLKNDIMNVTFPSIKLLELFLITMNIIIGI